ncbi:hypothetical protein [Lactiplantibacillus mudanjiangensis]|uniref:Uncharacterized protein n=1 Tax=Lactiplantibacillus mudanjiangensis TaxID=1296538 RepID=A0A660DXZ0_9LACO|nr:hypothetical protein [Lactiplantibacillus mudanjiangensis]VDG25730.1 hypothetical protein MUDAN_IGPPGNFN_03405 [Lactiplantibacillus mudanjiangensis]VDG27905.1 hypothetical protein MUDAN_MDHGFNIF_02722 [Lactiplantibacillus mudanjiangensis]
MNAQFYDIEIVFKGFDNSQSQSFRHVDKVMEQGNPNPVVPNELILKPATGYAVHHGWYSPEDQTKFDERITTFNSDSVAFITIKPTEY